MRETYFPWPLLLYRYWTIWRIYGKYWFYDILLGSFRLADLEPTPWYSFLYIDRLIIQARYR